MEAASIDHIGIFIPTNLAFIPTISTTHLPFRLVELFNLFLLVAFDLFFVIGWTFMIETPLVRTLFSHVVTVPA